MSPERWSSRAALLRDALVHLGDVGPHELPAPRRMGRRRAAQGAPLASVQSAFRIGFAFMWDCVVAEARRSGSVPDSELVRVASDVWTLHPLREVELPAASWVLAAVVPENIDGCCPFEHPDIGLRLGGGLPAFRLSGVAQAVPVGRRCRGSNG
jgi:hypothetical protein